MAHRVKRNENVAYEHTEFTSAKEIKQAAADAGIGLTYPYEGTFFRFADYRTDAVNDLADAPRPGASSSPIRPAIRRALLQQLEPEL